MNTAAKVGRRIADSIITCQKCWESVRMKHGGEK